MSDDPDEDRQTIGHKKIKKKKRKKKKDELIYLTCMGYPSLVVTVNLIMGGGVIGRLSLSPKPHMRALCGCCTTSIRYMLQRRTRPLAQIVCEYVPGFETPEVRAESQWNFCQKDRAVIKG